MAFTPETGTGVPEANSYCSVEYADAYFSLRGREAWAALTLERKQAALIDATDYINVRWGERFVGHKYSETQGLPWPRKMCHSTEPYYPDQLLRATCEYGIRASVSPLMPDPVVDETGRMPSLTREKLGPLEEEYRWPAPNTGASVMIYRPYPQADTLMYGLLGPNMLSGRVIR